MSEFSSSHHEFACYVSDHCFSLHLQPVWMCAPSLGDGKLTAGNSFSVCSSSAWVQSLWVCVLPLADSCLSVCNSPECVRPPRVIAARMHATPLHVCCLSESLHLNASSHCAIAAWVDATSPVHATSLGVCNPSVWMQLSCVIAAGVCKLCECMHLLRMFTPLVLPGRLPT